MREDVSNRIRISKLQKTTRVFTGLGNTLTKPIGKCSECLTIGADTFKDIFIVPTTSMTSELILGRTLLEEAEVLIEKNKITIRRISGEGTDETAMNTSTTNDSHVNEQINIEEIKTEITAEEQKKNGADKDTAEINDDIHKMMLLNHIEPNENEIPEPYKSKLSKLIEEYTSKEKVQTSVQTKIILSDDKPVNLWPRRLAPKEKQILDEQLKE